MGEENGLYKHYSCRAAPANAKTRVPPRASDGAAARARFLSAGFTRRDDLADNAHEGENPAKLHP